VPRLGQGGEVGVLTQTSERMAFRVPWLTEGRGGRLSEKPRVRKTKALTELKMGGSRAGREGADEKPIDQGAKGESEEENPHV